VLLARIYVDDATFAQSRGICSQPIYILTTCYWSFCWYDVY